jgi:hypothetical protein
MRRGFKALAALCGAFALLAIAAGAATTTLPGGTGFTVAVTAPAPGAVLPEAVPFTVSGHSTIGTAAPIANTYLVTAVDVSGSTFNPVSTTACGNVNTGHDTTPNTVLDCELAAARALNNEAVAQGTVAGVGLVGFAGRVVGTSLPLNNEAAILDVGPSGGQQSFTQPNANVNGNGQRDVDEVLASAYNENVAGTFGFPPGDLGTGFTSFSTFTSPGSTNYWAAVTQIKAAFLLLPPTVTKIAVILSDGDSTVGSPTGQTLQQLIATMPGIRIYTFAIGNVASCAGSGSGFGTLLEIAQRTGATCTHIANPGDAAGIVPDAIGSQITSPQLSDDGVTYVAPDGPAVPPFHGPGSIDFLKLFPASDATPGTHHLCARATGSDGGGSAVLPECIDVTILARPVVSAGSMDATPEGSPFALSGSADHGDTSWSASGGTGTCSFADPSSPTTSVTCTDDGDYTLTLTADDHVNAPVSASGTLHVFNVNPTAALTLSPGPHPLAQPVDATVAISDPGSDTFPSCVLNWGDGTISTGAVTGNVCTDVHIYAAGGPFSVSVTVTDDDLGSGSDAQLVVIDAPPIVHARPEFGNEGSPVPLFVDATDDVGVTGLEWSISGGTGTCTIADPHAASTPATCTDDGPYAAHVTVTDGVNPPVSDDVALNVLNVAPTVNALPVPGRIALGAPVTATFPFTDPGSGDTFTCLIEWGDAIVTPGTISGGACTGTHAYSTPGTKNAIATVTDDDGGRGSNATPLAIVVDAPPVVSAGSADLFANEGSSTILNGVVSDDSGTPSLHWSSAGGAAVDPGGACVFGNAALAVTTVSCNDDGTFTLTLTASDGLNAPVSSPVTLHVANVDPGLSLTGSASGLTATVTGTVTDVGSNDTHTCSFAWGDGSTTPGIAVAGGTCQASHTYASGTHSAPVTVTATDDDGGAATRTLTLTLNRPPSCSATTPSLTELWPPNHTLQLIVLGGATDPDGDALSYAITSVRQDEPTNGTGDGDTDIDAVNAGPGMVRLRSERSGNGDGRVYTIAFTVSDGKGGTCAGAVRVSVPKSASKPAVLTPGPGYDSYH